MNYILKKILLTMLCLLIFSVPIAAKSARITFLRGKVTIKYKKRLIKAKIGKRIPLKARIKTHSKAHVSILYGRQNLKITAGKSVILEEVLQKRGKYAAREMAFLGGMMRQPRGTVKRNPTKVAGIRGKSEGNVKGGQPTASGNNEKFYKMLESKKYRQVVKALRRSKDPEKMYIFSLALYSLNKKKKSERVILKALKKENKDQVKVKLEIALAAIFMESGRNEACLDRLKKLEKKVIIPFMTAEAWYLLFRNSEIIGEQDSAVVYKNKLKQYYASHQLTELAFSEY